MNSRNQSFTSLQGSPTDWASATVTSTPAPAMATTQPASMPILVIKRVRSLIGQASSTAYWSLRAQTSVHSAALSRRPEAAISASSWK